MFLEILKRFFLVVDYCNSDLTQLFSWEFYSEYHIWSLVCSNFIKMTLPIFCIFYVMGAWHTYAPVIYTFTIVCKQHYIVRHSSKKIQKMALLLPFLQSPEKKSTLKTWHAVNCLSSCFWKCTSFWTMLLHQILKCLFKSKNMFNNPLL